MSEIVQLCQTEDEILRSPALAAVANLKTQPKLIGPYVDKLLQIYIKTGPKPILGEHIM